MLRISKFLANFNPTKKESPIVKASTYKNKDDNILRCSVKNSLKSLNPPTP